MPAASQSGVSVTCRGITRRFGAQRVLTGIDFDLAPGEAVAIVGRSGCGKSTLLRLLSGLDVPDEGRITIANEPLDGIHPAVRVMFQDASLYPWKRVAANVALGLHTDPDGRAAWALQQVGLASRAQDWPRVLSGGQRQRVSLARALASHPRLLLLDEPLGALDALTRTDMQMLIGSLWRQLGFTLVLVTHDVEEAIVLADRVLVMEHGRWTNVFEVALPRPRDSASVPFAALRARILAAVRGEDATSPSLAVSA